MSNICYDESPMILGIRLFLFSEVVILIYQQGVWSFALNKKIYICALRST